MKLTRFNIFTWFSVQILPMYGYSHLLPIGFSYTKFSGPVSGPEQQFLIYDESGQPYVDYIAQPDYQFSYGIDDPKSGVQQSRKEIRRGDSVHGQYRVVQPDGTVRMVKYIADDVNGYQAEVTIDGLPTLYKNNQNIRVIPVHEHEQIPEPTKVPDDDQQSVTKVSPSQESNTSEDEENASTDIEDYSAEKNNEYRSNTSGESFHSSESEEDSD